MVGAKAVLVLVLLWRAELGDWHLVYGPARLEVRLIDQCEEKRKGFMTI
jgi:hypothetical protein